MQERVPAWEPAKNATVDSRRSGSATPDARAAVAAGVFIPDPNALPGLIEDHIEEYERWDGMS